MAKKKGKSGNKAAPQSENTSPTNVVEPEGTNAQTIDAPSPEQSVADAGQPVDTPSDAATPASTSGQGDLEELRRELASYKARVVELETMNKVLSEENQRLKSSQGASSQAPTADAGHLEALTQRIANLKAEQAEADAAREAAWAQLKSVVADIARLAAPDGAGKVGTPTAASAAAAFGAA